MRNARLPGIVFLAFLAVAAFPAKGWAFDSAQSYVQTQFLPPQLLPPPPAADSKAQRAQIDAVIHAQQGLSETELAALRNEQYLRIDLMTSVLGPSFNRARLPKTFAMLDRVFGSAEQVTEADKKFWRTRRPYLSDPRVKLYVDPIDDSPSYPSGHTTASRVLAEVLGMLAPDQRAALRARAEDIARRRVEAGVHYPVDLEAGRTLALLIVGALTANKDFQDDLVAAKNEVAGK
ncbi:MAG: phosphatase PAP2 family protein [Alphaproteobacteria bacterium]|nr:phosphatase PAP2 family protein [Alphaproteobacteria bacterium]